MKINNVFPKSAFTMIELMVSVAVLSLGLVSIIRSVNLTVFGLNRIQNQYYAARICRQAIEETGKKIVQGVDIDMGETEREVQFKGKRFLVSTEIELQNISLEDFPQVFSDAEKEQEHPQISDELYVVAADVRWQERGIQKGLKTETYFLSNE